MTSSTGKNVSASMQEHASGNAKSALNDQVIFNVDAERFKELNALLDAPASRNPGLERLMAIKTPWRHKPPRKA